MPLIYWKYNKKHVESKEWLSILTAHQSLCGGLPKEVLLFSAQTYAQFMIIVQSFVYEVLPPEPEGTTIISSKKLLADMSHALQPHLLSRHSLQSRDKSYRSKIPNSQSNPLITMFGSAKLHSQHSQLKRYFLAVPSLVQKYLILAYKQYLSFLHDFFLQEFNIKHQDMTLLLVAPGKLPRIITPFPVHDVQCICRHSIQADLAQYSLLLKQDSLASQ